MSGRGPILPTWAAQQVVSYLGCSGRDANAVARAAGDPELTWACGNLAIMFSQYLRKMESSDGWLTRDDADEREKPRLPAAAYRHRSSMLG